LDIATWLRKEYILGFGPRAQSVWIAVDTHELPDGVVIPVVKVGRSDNENTEVLVVDVMLDVLVVESVLELDVLLDELELELDASGR